ncbi:hypothetical protein BUALT_Bualt05G0002600 [Buddleja alternifolia]|uniref:Transmembrane protein n=1 Tax=Buddleja alternifolia TaxID=168488 RepID=A0AAV6XFG3_9LAMI|nr:hypothetical protein BUALT_Bualt05G0002600 [Buddleja alternifolia]
MLLCLRWWSLFMVYLLTTLLLLLSSTPLSFSLEHHSFFPTHQIFQISGKYSSGVDLGWGISRERLVADNSSEEGEVDDEYSSSSGSSLVLAPRRTYRKDPLDGFQRYRGGWNISNRHYWAVHLSLSLSPKLFSFPCYKEHMYQIEELISSLSVTPPFHFLLLGQSGLWSSGFAYLSSVSATVAVEGSLMAILELLTPSLSFSSYSLPLLECTLSLSLPLSLSLTHTYTRAGFTRFETNFWPQIFSIGCVVLYTGQGKFHSSTINTLEYVVHQADVTSENLRNVSEYLSAAKQINVDQVSLSSNVQTDIDQIQAKISSSASTLADKTQDNSKDIKHLIESVRLALIILSAAMLLLTFLGFVFSIFGMQFPVYILVITGWIIVTGTFILCGIFLLLHNVTGDTCVAMNQWVQYPTAHTALDDILPCVDNATAQETLTRSKEVTSQLVDLVNTVISNVSNINFAPNFVPFYFNQSGPLVPSLCNPFNHDLTDRACTSGEVDLNNATQVWNGFVCQTSPNGICTTPGRLNPTMYGQMTAAVNVSYGLYHYGPFLVDLEDCTFVRQTFMEINAMYCPGLRRDSERIYVGLVMVSSAVMLSLVFWVIYGRERRHRVYTKEHMPRGDEGDNNKAT